MLSCIHSYTLHVECHFELGSTTILPEKRPSLGLFETMHSLLILLCFWLKKIASSDWVVSQNLHCISNVYNSTLQVYILVQLVFACFRLLLAFQRRPLYVLEMNWEPGTHSELSEPPTSALLWPVQTNLWIFDRHCTSYARIILNHTSVSFPLKKLQVLTK